eukprot:12595785-Alexandrium_andersonii.AAC.1
MLEEKLNFSEHAAAASDPVYAHSAAIRSEAMAALERLGATDKWRRAILADHRPPTEHWEPGPASTSGEPRGPAPTSRG